jgi:hypothetical protein
VNAEPDQLLRALLLPCYYLVMRSPPILATTFLAASFLLCACSPKYNWRDYTSADAPYRIMFPGKPASYTRNVNLNGMQVDMTMTATEVEGAMYAVGTAQAPDAAKAQSALEAMQVALVRNIGATKTRRTASAASARSGAPDVTSSDVEAEGVLNGVPMRLVGHFEARGDRFYQVVVMGPAKSITTEPTEQFISSFKIQ